MKLEDELRYRIQKGALGKCPDQFQGIDKKRIRRILRATARETDDMVDVVFALLDNLEPSWFSNPGFNTKFADGASTAHIACHVGIYQRGKNKLDREGRDYWLKPLWEIGALEKITYEGNGSFVSGHPVPKSPNSAYRIAAEFLAILKIGETALEAGLVAWNSIDASRSRLARQAAAAHASKQYLFSEHQQLIVDICAHYTPHFLPDFYVVYIDDADGDRVSEEHKKKLAIAGLKLTLEDSMPDVLLWNPKTDILWVVEAVCSDGEVDFHKFANLTNFAMRNVKQGIGFTTAYPDWKTAYGRQQKMKNLAPNSYLWIREDAAKQLYVSILPTSMSASG